MAVRQDSTKDILQALPECSICYEVFRDPRLLTGCGHTFCKVCLEEHVRKQTPQARVVWCPMCRKQMPLQEEGVQGLPRNYSVQSMIDKIQDMSVSSAAASAPEEGATCLATPAQEKYTAKCKKHVTEVANFCCETCEGILICRDCTVLDHKDCNYVNVKDKSDQCTQQLLDLFSEHQALTGEIIAVDRRKTVSSIRENSLRLQHEIKEISSKKIKEIKTAEEKNLALAQRIGQALEEKADLMFYNENPIDAIVEMMQRGNEYEISESFSEAQLKLAQSLSEMRQKMNAKHTSSMAKCLSFKNSKSEQQSAESSLCNVVFTDLSWKQPSRQMDLSTLNDVVSFTSSSSGSWFILERLLFNQFSISEIFPNGKYLKRCTVHGKALDVLCRKDGALTVLHFTNGEWQLALVLGSLATKFVLPIKPLTNGSTVVTSMDSQDHLCIPETNGYNIWKVNSKDGKAEEFSVCGYTKPTNAVCQGTTLFFINSKKKIMQRKMAIGSIPTECESEAKLGEPIQLLVDPRTEETLVVYQRVSESQTSELSIHQLGSHRSLVNTIKLDCVPRVIKANISSASGNLSILVFGDRDKRILHYEREDLPALSDFLGEICTPVD